MRGSVLLPLIALLAAGALACSSAQNGTVTELKVVVHSSFDAKHEVIEAFEREHHAKVTFLKGGDANAVVNRALLNAGHPEGDVLYGIDNLTYPRVVGKGVFADFTAT